MVKYLIFLLFLLLPGTYAEASYYLSKDKSNVILELFENDSTYLLVMDNSNRSFFFTISRGHFFKRENRLVLIDDYGHCLLKYKFSGKSILSPIQTFHFLKNTELYLTSFSDPINVNWEECDNFNLRPNSSDTNFHLSGDYLSFRIGDHPPKLRILPLLDNGKAAFWLRFFENKYLIYYQDRIISSGEFYLTDNTVFLHDEHLQATFALAFDGDILIPRTFFYCFPYCAFRKSVY